MLTSSSFSRFGAFFGIYHDKCHVECGLYYLLMGSLAHYKSAIHSSILTVLGIHEITLGVLTGWIVEKASKEFDKKKSDYKSTGRFHIFNLGS